MNDFHLTKENWPDCPDGNNCMFCHRYSPKEQEKQCATRRMRARTARKLERLADMRRKAVTNE